MGAPTDSPQVYLRVVQQSDVPIFFEHQLDNEATEMAAFPARDQSTFSAHWKNILRDELNITRTIVFRDRVAGNIASWGTPSERLVGYWIGKPYWGRGIATTALADFLAIEHTRPLYAHVAKHNLRSLRVLEKCGFSVSGEDTTSEDGVEEFILELPAGDKSEAM